jgi:hypothetical protein
MVAMVAILSWWVVAVLSTNEGGGTRQSRSSLVRNFF